MCLAILLGVFLLPFGSDCTNLFSRCICLFWPKWEKERNILCFTSDSSWFWIWYFHLFVFVACVYSFLNYILSSNDIYSFVINKDTFSMNVDVRLIIFILVLNCRRVVSLFVPRFCNRRLNAYYIYVHTFTRAKQVGK